MGLASDWQLFPVYKNSLPEYKGYYFSIVIKMKFEISLETMQIPMSA
jgi:hypothetical protein